MDSILADVEQSRQPKAAIYVRISDDRTKLGLGVERQAEDARALATRRGWEVVAELADNDLTAKGTKPRPGFDELMRLIEAREIDVVVAWTWERLERNRREGLRLIEAGQAASLTISLCRGSDIDMSTPAGRLVADVLSATARNEIEVKADRQRRALDQKLQRGERWGGRRPFGYTTTMAPIEAEAEAVRDGYAMLLAGASLTAIAADWDRRGLSTPQSPKGTDPGTPNHWSAGSMRKCLLKSCYAGLREHKGVVVGEAAWPAIVDRPTWEAAQQLLRNRVRPHPTTQLLLTGVALCGVCGATVHASGARHPGLPPGYRCSKSAHLTRNREPVDRYVEAAALARLRRPDARKILAPAAPDLGPIRREAEQLRARRDALADDLDLDEVTLGRRVRAINARLDEIATTEAAAVQGHRLAGIATAEDVELAWRQADVPTRRLVIDALMTVELKPLGRGTRTFRAESVVITPR